MKIITLSSLLQAEVIVQWYYTNRVAIERILVKSTTLATLLSFRIFLRIVGIGTWIRVPVGVPLSSMRTMLLLSNLGTRARCFCLTPTITAFFFWPLIATSTLSPEIEKAINNVKYFYGNFYEEKKIIIKEIHTNSPNTSWIVHMNAFWRSSFQHGLLADRTIIHATKSSQFNNLLWRLALMKVSRQRSHHWRTRIQSVKKNRHFFPVHAEQSRCRLLCLTDKLSIHPTYLQWR